jgi:hypothetical protein
MTAVASSSTIRASRLVPADLRRHALVVTTRASRSCRSPCSSSRSISTSSWLPCPRSDATWAFRSTRSNRSWARTRWPRRGRGRAASGPRGWSRAVRKRITPRRHREQLRALAGSARDSGRWRRACLPGHALPRQHNLRRGTRKEPSRGGMGCRGRRGARDRRPSRWAPHAWFRLGGGLSRQRAACRGPHRPWVLVPSQGSQARARPRPRHPGCGHRHAWTHVPRVCVGRGSNSRMGFDDGRPRRGREPYVAGRLRHHRASQRRSALVAELASEPQPARRRRRRLLVLGDLRFGPLPPVRLPADGSGLRRARHRHRVPAAHDDRGVRLCPCRPTDDAIRSSADPRGGAGHRDPWRRCAEPRDVARRVLCRPHSRTDRGEHR